MWVAASILIPMLGFGGLNLFPGIVLVFVARAIRTQAARNAPTDPEEVEPEPQIDSSERILNTERRQPPSPPAPAQSYRAPEQRPEPAASERNELLEKIVLAGRETVEETSPGLDERAPEEEIDVMGPMSSAEMIARAHKRWDRGKG